MTELKKETPANQPEKSARLRNPDEMSTTQNSIEDADSTSECIVGLIPQPPGTSELEHRKRIAKIATALKKNAQRAKQTENRVNSNHEDAQLAREHIRPPTPVNKPLPVDLDENEELQAEPEIDQNTHQPISQTNRPTPNPFENRNNNAKKLTASERAQAQKHLNHLKNICNEIPGQPTILGSHVSNQGNEYVGMVPDHNGPTVQTGVIQGGKIFVQATQAYVANLIGAGYTGNRSGGATPQGNSIGFTNQGEFGGENNFGLPEQTTAYLESLTYNELNNIHTYMGNNRSQSIQKANNLNHEQRNDAYGVQTTAEAGAPEEEAEYESPRPTRR